MIRQGAARLKFVPQALTRPARGFRGYINSSISDWNTAGSIPARPSAIVRPSETSRAVEIADSQSTPFIRFACAKLYGTAEDRTRQTTETGSLHRGILPCHDHAWA